MPDAFRVIVIFEFSEYERELVAEYQKRIELRKGIPKQARRSDLRIFVRESVNSRWLRMQDDLAELDRDEERKKYGEAESDAHDL